MFLPENTEWFYLNIDFRKLQTGDGKGELCQTVVKKTSSPQPLAPVHIVPHEDTIVSSHKLYWACVLNNCLWLSCLPWYQDSRPGVLSSAQNQKFV